MPRQTGFTPAATQTVVADTVFSGPMLNVPDFDPVDILPARAADRLRKLRQRAEDLHKIVPQFEQVDQINIERIKTERELKRLTDAASDGGFNLPATDARVIAATARQNKLTAEAARLTQLKQTRSATWQTTAQVLRAVEEWLRGKPSGTVEDFDGPAPPLNRGETVLDGVERLRRRGRELQADLHRIQSAPFPSSEAKRRAREQVEILAQRGTASVSQLVEHADGKLQFQRELLKVSLHNIPQAPAAVGYAEIVDPVAVVAWLFRDALIKRLDAEIDSEADDKAALSPDDRQRKEAVVLSDLLAIERQEAEMVWRGQNEMLPVEHRADADPRAILGVQLVTITAAKVERPDTTWMHGATLVGR